MKVLSIIVLIIIFPLFFLALFGLSLKYTVQKPEFLKKELISQKVYDKINKNIPEIVNLFGENKESGETPILTNTEIGSLLQQTLTAETLKQNTEMFLDGTAGKQGSAAMQTQVTDNINKLIEAKFNALPVCTSGSGGGDMSCRPPGVTFQQVLAQLPTQAGNNPLFSANATPQTATPTTSENPQIPQAQSGPSLSSLSSIGKFANLTYILPIILIFIIFFLARGFAGSWLGSGKVFGIFLAVLSVLSLLTSFLLSLFNKPIASLVSGFANGLPKLKTELVVPLLNDILGKISQMTNKISIVSAIIGVVLFIIFLIISKIKKKGVVPVAAPPTQ